MHFTIPSSWPYFHRLAPVGGGVLLTGIKGPNKIHKLTDAFYENAGCLKDDLSCMREVPLPELWDASLESTSALYGENVALGQGYITRIQWLSSTHIIWPICNI